MGSVPDLFLSFPFFRNPMLIFHGVLRKIVGLFFHLRFHCFQVCLYVTVGVCPVKQETLCTQSVCDPQTYDTLYYTTCPKNVKNKNCIQANCVIFLLLRNDDDVPKMYSMSL